MARRSSVYYENSTANVIGRSAPRAAPRAAPVRNPPQPASRAPPPAPVQGGSGGSMLGGLGATIAQGMAFGTGSAVAHRAVDAIVGPRTIQHEAVVSEAVAAPAATTNSFGSDACGVHTKAFQDLQGPPTDLEVKVCKDLTISEAIKTSENEAVIGICCARRWKSREVNLRFIEDILAIYLCLNSSGNDISKCQFYMDMLSECKRNSGSMMGA
ncbi:hypothetical protein RHSIM_Rhsim05G0100900 [Rhododendron simsii]|uniref:CHCH domain-containing protein n=1 Tax=Rhododendron simsii TaxID=118357 RepID=A0A834H1I5_RHOSS|nr:hypothetical protein RHSIM_Rhsim05G0100900 [Rhododendron simsii]